MQGVESTKKCFYRFWAAVHPPGGALFLKTPWEVYWPEGWILEGAVCSLDPVSLSLDVPWRKRGIGHSLDISCCELSFFSCFFFLQGAWLVHTVQLPCKRLIQWHQNITHLVGQQVTRKEFLNLVLMWLSRLVTLLLLLQGPLWWAYCTCTHHLLLARADPVAFP